MTRTKIKWIGSDAGGYISEARTAEGIPRFLVGEDEGGWYLSDRLFWDRTEHATRAEAMAAASEIVALED